MKLSKVIKKLFLTSILGGLMPILRIEGDETEAGNNNSTSDSSSNDGKNNSNANNNSNGGENSNNIDGDDDKSSGGKIVFDSQAALDAMINKRINRSVKNAKKEYENEVAKLKMSETDRLQAEKKEAENKANEAITRANNMLVKAEIIQASAKLNIVDSDAAYKLLDKDDIEIDENGNISGVEKALKALILDKPYLIVKNDNNSNNNSVGDDINKNSSSKSNKMSMNYLIRKAAGRTD